MNDTNTKRAIIRMTSELRGRLETLLFHRYPYKEWGTFFLFGTRQTSEALVITIVDIIEPGPGDLNTDVSIVEFNEPYSLRAALEKQKRHLCVGVIHSHPQGYSVTPSVIDDDMDSYYASFFPSFGSESVYFSLIFSKSRTGDVTISGRGWNSDEAFTVTDFITVSNTIILRTSSEMQLPHKQSDPYRSRLEELYGQDAAKRLSTARVVIVGVSGTGSPAAHALARAGVKDFILIDPQRLDKSNLERIHGSYHEHFSQTPAPYKVEVVRDLIKAINPEASVIGIVGNILQPLARDYSITADLIICCTDTNHSRAGISELAYRYLIPALDVGVVFESAEKKITGEVCRITQYSPGSPCAYCLELIDSWRATVELMSDEEKQRRREEARLAALRGEEGNPYWRDSPELITVGHFTSVAGALIASYGIGWITGKFSLPHSYIEFDILKAGFGYIGFDAFPKQNCTCKSAIGLADQGAAYTVVTAPQYWPEAELLFEG